METVAELRSRIARVRFEDGLGVSAEVISEVIAFNARDGDGGWFTEPERDDMFGDPERVQRTRAVLADAEHVVSRIEVCWSHGRRAVRVFMTRERERYGELLGNALGPDRVVIDHARYSDRDLRGYEATIQADSLALADRGVYITHHFRTPDGLELEYYAADFEAADRLLDDRYGAFAQISYKGASRYAICEQPFGSWHADGNQLHVFYALYRNGEQPANATVIEREDSVIVAVTILDWRGAKTLIGGFTPSELTVELLQPLGERAVIDNAENRARPHWRQAATIALPRPQDM
jgi:hypothetical protein